MKQEMKVEPGDEGDGGDESWGVWKPNMEDRLDGSDPASPSQGAQTKKPQVIPALVQDLQPLKPSEVEKGMVVVFDTHKRGWVDNCFPDLDEFWLCDEATNMTIFKLTEDGQEDSVRAFTAKELLFTGQWTPLVEVSKDVLITPELVKKLLELPSWEATMEEETGGVSITIDKTVPKVMVGPGSPPQIKKAYTKVKENLEQIDRQLWEGPEPVNGPGEKSAVKPELLDLLGSEVKVEIKEEVATSTVKAEQVQRKRPRQADLDEMEEGFRNGFERGFEKALKMVQRKLGEGDGDAFSLLSPRMPLREATTPGAPGDVTPAPSENASVPKPKPKRVMDWAREQDQFAHLPKLPPNWIRVKKSSGDGVYFVNTMTGETTFDDPLEAKPGTSTPAAAFSFATPAAPQNGGLSSATPAAPMTPTVNPFTPAPLPLPEGWTQMKSKTTGKPYYWNAKLGISQFHFPTNQARRASALAETTP